jgi:hypothetical protein
MRNATDDNRSAEDDRLARERAFIEGQIARIDAEFGRRIVVWPYIVGALIVGPLLFASGALFAKLVLL